MPNATGAAGQLWCSVSVGGNSPTHTSAPAGTAIPLRGPDHLGSEPFPMTDKQPSAPARTQSGHSGYGLTHVNEPHHDNFTVVGNHLAQPPALSLTAIGLAVHIQPLPAGTHSPWRGCPGCRTCSSREMWTTVGPTSSTTRITARE